MAAPRVSSRACRNGVGVGDWAETDVPGGGEQGCGNVKHAGRCPNRRGHNKKRKVER